MDISPLRRVNSAIYLISTGAREAAFRNIKTIAECLADELINAAKGSSNRCCHAPAATPAPACCLRCMHSKLKVACAISFSWPDWLVLSGSRLTHGLSCSYAIKKKDELERVAKANR